MLKSMTANGIKRDMIYSRVDLTKHAPGKETMKYNNKKKRKRKKKQ